MKIKPYFPFFSILGFVLLWQGASSWGLVDHNLIPSPWEVTLALWDLGVEGTLPNHIGTSLYRVFIGFALAAVCAIPLGILLGSLPRLNVMWDPLIQILRPISPIAWIPLAILWFGVGDRPAIFIIFITALFPIMLTTSRATKNVDTRLIKSAINFGARGRELFQKVIFPAIFPSIMTGLRVALGISWVIIVAAEMVGMRSGLGYMILDARNFLRLDLVVGGMVVVGIIGLIIDKLMNATEARIRRHWGGNDNHEFPFSFFTRK